MVWRSLAVILLAVPAGVLTALGVLLTPPAALIPLLLLLPGLAGLATYALATTPPTTTATTTAADRAEPDAPTDPARTGRVHRRGVRLGFAVARATVTAVLVTGGLVGVAGPAAGPLLLVAGAAAAPWVWIRARRHGAHPGLHSGSGPIEPNPAPGPRPLVRVLATLSTPALCAEWQRSLQVLTTAPDQATRNDVAALRRGYLDELERRDPDAVARWLTTDPRPAGTNPARHLSRLDTTAPPHRSDDHQ